MRGYSQIGLIRSLGSYPLDSDALHHAPIVLLFSGDVVRACGRGKMIAIEGEEVGSVAVGPFRVVWGSDDSAVADIVGEGHARIVYVGPEEPGNKTKAALEKLKKSGSHAFSVGPEVSGVGRIDCEGSRAGVLDLLVGAEWIKHEPPAPPKAPAASKKKKKKKPVPKGSEE